MTEHEFKVEFTRLCANYGKSMNTEAVQTKGDMLYERYKKTPKDTFRKTLDLVMERHGATYGFFPSVKEISGCMSNVIVSDGGSKVNDCPVCRPQKSGHGAVTMIVVFKERPSRGNNRIVLYRLLWTYELSRTPVEVGYPAEFNVCCRCDAGKALYHQRQGNTYQLTVEEYDKLLKGKPKKEGQEVMSFD